MAEETEKTKIEVKKKKSWFQRIPKDVLLSPAGVVLILLAIIIEIVDLIPIPILDQVWELPLEILFIVLLTILAKVPLKSSVIPFIIERIPLINDLLPTWLIRMIA
jgi:hypothetical protein